MILVASAIFLRRWLRLKEPSGRGMGTLARLSADRERLYAPFEQEMETQCTILGISLNDAIDELESGHDEIAWRLVGLFASEWGRVAEILGGLHKTLGKHIGEATVAVPVRSMAADGFKSHTMINYFRMHEFLDQLVFRSRMRFQLQVRVLRRATETLTAEFVRTHLYADRTGYRPREFWQRLDVLFHDFDLLGKETLLAFRAFLTCLPESSIPRIAADLELVLPSHERAVTARVRE